MAVDVSMTRMGPRTIAFLHRKGSFAAIPAALEELFTWVDDRSLQPMGPPGGRYFTDPSRTPVDENAWEVFVEIAIPTEPVPDDVAEDGEPADRPRIHNLPEAEFATTLHRGPYDRVSETYARLGAWLSEHGYAHAGPSEEIYLSEPYLPPDELLTEVRIPVVRRATTAV